MRVSRIIIIASVASALLLVGVVALTYKIVHNPDPYTSQAPPQLPNPPLKALATSRGIEVGNFASLKYLRERAYTDILASEFNYLIVDGEPNWRFEDSALRPSQTEFNFTDLDKVFDFAKQNAMPVRVQHLMWGDAKWLPDWLTQGNFTREQLLDIIHTHIATVGAHYKGRVREYSVVNEAFSRKLLTGGNHDWWGERLDTEYIDKSFIWAHEADPNAVLILNDFGNEGSDGPLCIFKLRGTDQIIINLKLSLEMMEHQDSLAKAIGAHLETRAIG